MSYNNSSNKAIVVERVPKMHMQNSNIEETMPFDSMMKMLKTEFFNYYVQNIKRTEKLISHFTEK